MYTVVLIGRPPTISIIICAIALIDFTGIRAAGGEVVNFVLVDSDGRRSNSEGGAGGGGAGEDGGSDDIFYRFLDDAAHWASAHFGIVAFFYQNLFGFVGDDDGDFLAAKGFVGGSNHEIKNF